MANALQAVQKETVDIVSSKIKKFRDNGELRFPKNYSPENALKSAWLIIQATSDKNNKPALEVCTKDSIANALLSMVIQGLNPDKKQCYFIPYGSVLTMQRSYFGSISVVKHVDPDIDDVYSDTVYEGDVFKYSKRHGVTTITVHEQALENIKKDKIVAAYAVVLYQDGHEVTTIMTMDEIEQAWKQSKMGVFDENGKVKESSVHGKFTAEMAKKTVVNRACKSVINSSDDGNLVAYFARKSDEVTAEAEVAEEIAEHANTEAIDVDYSDVPAADPATGEAREIKPAAIPAPPTPRQAKAPAATPAADISYGYGKPDEFDPFK